MKHKEFVLIGIVIVSLLAGGYFWWSATFNQDTATAPINQEVQSSVEPFLETGSTHQEAAPANPDQQRALDPVSLPALMEKQYDGRDLTLVKTLDSNNKYTRHQISYRSGNLTISGIMNVPKGDGPFPVLILNHGYIDPSIYTNGRGLRREQDYLASRGYVVLHPDYRNHAFSDKDPDSELNLRLGYVEDVINAVYAVKRSDLSFVDKEGIGMLGHSMGGGITLNILVTRPDLVQASVLFAPVSADNRDNFQRWTTRRPETANKIIEAYGSPDKNPAFWDNVSANTFISNIQTPIMLHHGSADEDVPIAWSEQLQGLLDQKGKTITYHVYPGQPHEFTSAWPTVMERSVDFFDQYLR